jgi:RNA polymerase sigma factor (sigma-70 family)
VLDPSHQGASQSTPGPQSGTAFFGIFRPIARVRGHKNSNRRLELKGLEPDWDALIQDCFEHPRSHAILGRFFEAILPYLRAALSARSIGDRSLIEDALQSAFVKYMDIFQKGPIRRVNLGYFVVVAKNGLIDELRRRKGHLAIDDVAESELPSVSASTTDENSDRILLIQHAMAQLDSRCQFILESYYIDEVDAIRLAGWLKIAPDSVHVAIKRCRDRLKTAVAKLTAPTSQLPV